jgi:hypothetical protein
MKNCNKCSYHLSRYFLTFHTANFFYIIDKNSVRTSWETYYVFATKIYQSVLFRKRVTLNCGNHTKHTNTLFRREF